MHSRGLWTCSHHSVPSASSAEDSNIAAINGEPHKLSHTRPCSLWHLGKAAGGVLQVQREGVYNRTARQQLLVLCINLGGSQREALEGHRLQLAQQRDEVSALAAQLTLQRQADADTGGQGGQGVQRMGP